MATRLSTIDQNLAASGSSSHKFARVLFGIMGQGRVVTVRQGDESDLEMLYAMYAETAVRDEFAIRGKDYYLALWRTFLSAGMLVPLIAELEGQNLAGLMLFVFDGSSWYLHGMSTDAHRNLMPTYLLQWEAMRVSKERGCKLYDLWGAPNEFSEDDSMWGVFRFKEGLGGQVVRTVGAWDLPLRPWVFRLYTQVWPRIMDVLRSVGRARTRKTLEGADQ
ncbi:MAG: peptidoglycan bridge formation glycyltransferase FemA/FemB family protein, partial [Anaerolineales bacterium]